MTGAGGAAGERLRRPAHPRPLAPLLLALAVLMAGLARPAGRESLRIRTGGGGWVEWWRYDPAAERCAPEWHPLLDRADWRAVAPGFETAHMVVSPGGAPVPIALTVVRFDPGQVRLSLVWGLDPAGGRPDWSIDDAPGDARLAVNAGMFLQSLPWGWVRLDGVERLPPARGPLSSAFAVDRSGSVHWVDGDDVAALRARDDLTLAFQSYPTLLVRDGELPAALRREGAIDLHHRDIRLALGLDRNGRLLVVLTRLESLLPGTDRLPVGLTVPEMARIMGSLGAARAMLLDGGLSAQLLLRARDGSLVRRPGLRRVPLALVARER